MKNDIRNLINNVGEKEDIISVIFILLYKEIYYHSYINNVDKVIMRKDVYVMKMVDEIMNVYFF